ncbi:hypothetical protein GCM10023075_26410 [Streptosporangium album]
MAVREVEGEIDPFKDHESRDGDQKSSDLSRYLHDISIPLPALFPGQRVGHLMRICTKLP